MISPAHLEAPPPPRDLADWLLARGRHWITSAEVASLLRIPSEQVAPRLASSRRRNQLFSPTKGAYVPIPPEYRSWGAVPAAHFIDPMMRHLGHPYYVGLLSAAEQVGVAHQRPQVFQVVTTARLRDRSFGRVGISFVTVGEMASRPTIARNTPTGTIRVSTPEVTIFDLVAMPGHAGGLSNVATIVGGMLEEGLLAPGDVADVARGYPSAVAQRAGWLLDLMGEETGTSLDLGDLHAVAHRRTTPTLLLAGGPQAGPLDDRWNVVVNGQVESDL